MNPSARLGRNGQFLTRDDATLYFEDAGSGSVVVLLHGGMGDLTDTDEWACELETTNRVIAVDFRCHGRSSAPLTTLSYEQFTDDVLFVLRHLGLTKIAIVGYSDGGIVGLKLAARAAGPVAGVVAIGANANAAGLRPEMRSNLIEAGAEDTFFGRMQTLWTTEVTVTPEELGSIIAPTLIVGGDRDEYISVEHFVELYEALAHGKLAIVPEADHSDSAFRPDVIRSVIVPFVTRF